MVVSTHVLLQILLVEMCMSSFSKYKVLSFTLPPPCPVTTLALPLFLTEASSRPFFLHQPAPITDAIAGSTARLPCEADGFPTPTISWFMTPQEADTPVTQVYSSLPLLLSDTSIPVQILPSQRFVVSPEELVIFDVRPSDEGFYFCGLENEFVQRNSTLGQFNVWSESCTPQLQ